MGTRIGLVSVGYEGRSAADLVALLVAADVDVVVDVRLNAISRKPGLSKTRLSESLADAGLGYVHLRALGNPRENREPFWTGRIAEGVRRFRDLLAAPGPAASIDELVHLASTSRVAVLCFERDHGQCHRQVVTEVVADRTAGAEVVLA